MVARGGLRWSDRREDFRTEVLGLVKAQQVKNAVIVPVGSKGGFVVKRPPAPEAGREAFLNEGIECYKTFIRGLLDITDNLSGGNLVPPEDVRRHDGDDPYLVVAADKGTATFSDIANGVSVDYGHWLDDAFASGGSAGYDHKKMGITARGAWESVKRHFREIGKDIQTQDFTCVGVGDMSGDVFGHPDPGLHLRRRRRHERRRLRQWHALVQAHQAGGRFQPPAYLRRPGPGPGEVLGRARPPLCAAPIELERL
jgi:glutamate dehydrogenase